MTDLAARRAELRDTLAGVHDRIAAACAQAHRDPASITLIAVTKYFPASDAALLAELGVCDLGENKDQEASAKAVAVAELTDLPVRWHFVGQLQSNKARSVAAYAWLVHSLDRASLASALDRGVQRLQRAPLPVLLQVRFDDDPARGGLAPDQLPELAERVMSMSGLQLAGVMTVAPPEADPDDTFAELADISEQVRTICPDAGIISAGMSGDLEAAVRHGATHLRIGTALLGRRPRVFG